MKDIANEMFNAYLEKDNVVFTDQTGKKKDIVNCIFNVFGQYDNIENTLQTKKPGVGESLNHLSSFVMNILEFNCNSTRKIEEVKKNIQKELAKVAAIDPLCLSKVSRDFKNRPEKSGIL